MENSFYPIEEISNKIYFLDDDGEQTIGPESGEEEEITSMFFTVFTE